jgi:hypothetical protein
MVLWLAQPEREHETLRPLHSAVKEISQPEISIRYAGLRNEALWFRPKKTGG